MDVKKMRQISLTIYTLRWFFDPHTPAIFLIETSVYRFCTQLNFIRMRVVPRVGFFIPAPVGCVNVCQ